VSIREYYLVGILAKNGHTSSSEILKTINRISCTCIYLWIDGECPVDAIAVMLFFLFAAKFYLFHFLDYHRQQQHHLPDQQHHCRWRYHQDWWLGCIPSG